MSNSLFVKTIGTVLAVGLGTEIIYQLYLYVKRSGKCKISMMSGSGKTKVVSSESDRLSVGKVLFFPDKSVACKNYFISESGCQNKKCKFSHENSSLGTFFCHLNSAKSSLDVCVFTISCDALVDIVISRAESGVKVRVITDDEQANAPGSQIWKLRRNGVALRTDRSSFFMHHKFVIIDGCTLINGSFNWTRQAITGNQENLMIINTADIIMEYQREFNRLWKQFDPKLDHGDP